MTSAMPCPITLAPCSSCPNGCDRARPANEPPVRFPCECCERDTPTAICLTADGEAVVLCIDCSDLLTEAERD